MKEIKGLLILAMFLNTLFIISSIIFIYNSKFEWSIFLIINSYYLYQFFKYYKEII